MNLEVFPGTERLFEADWTMFWKLKANLSKVPASEKLPDREFPFRVSSDASGRRLTPDATVNAPSVLFVGDSCTFGIPVNDHEAFPARIGKALGVRAINAGVPGYTAFQGRLLLDKLAGRPQAVVLTFWSNGLGVWDHLSDREHFELLAARRANEFSKVTLTRLLRRATPGSRPRLSEEEFEQELTASIVQARRIGAAPLLVVWPYSGQMSGEPENPRQTIVRRVGAANGVPVADLAPKFRQRGGRDLFVDRIHVTSEGYEIAAETIGQALKPLLGR
jgi:lysophospholipase L1-like esterase